MAKQQRAILPQKRRISEVNINDDDEMVRLGLRLPKEKGRDEQWWHHTPAEVKRRAQLKSTAPELTTTSSKPKYSIGLKNRLTIYIKGGEKATVSHYCYSNEIYKYLKRYKTGKARIIKYSFAGKTYQEGEYPVELKRNMRLA